MAISSGAYSHYKRLVMRWCHGAELWDGASEAVARHVPPWDMDELVLRVPPCKWWFKAGLMYIAQDVSEMVPIKQLSELFHCCGALHPLEAANMCLVSNCCMRWWAWLQEG
eukprot:scaffold32159_cov21-Tisochrysis_lutea.AAC.2